MKPASTPRWIKETADGERVYHLVADAITAATEDEVMVDGGAAFIATLTMAARIFAMCSFEAGDTKEEVEAHLRFACEHLVARSLDGLKDYELFKAGYDDAAAPAVKH
jgi:hypothetical protein